MNNVQLVGRVGREIQLQYTENKGIGYLNLALAVDGGWNKAKQEKRTDWIPVTVWGKLAENCAKGLVKGSLIAVTGRVSTGSYEKDGKKVYTTDIVAEGVDFLSRPKQK